MGNWDALDLWEDMEGWSKRVQKMFLRDWPMVEEFAESFPVDISETDSELVIKADLPGFEKTDVAIRTTENAIEIAAKRKQQRIEQKENYYRAERSMGGVRRILPLPVSVDPDTAKVEFKNGVLTITLEKKQKKKVGKQVKVF
jgi:HSP20 family protein